MTVNLCEACGLNRNLPTRVRYVITPEGRAYLAAARAERVAWAGTTHSTAPSVPQAGRAAGESR